MPSGWRKPARKHQVLTGAVVTQSEAVSVVSFSAQTQQIVGQALRQIEFAADHMIDRLPIGKLKELRGGTQLLPQLSCAGVAWPVSGAAKPLTACSTAPRALQNSSSCRWRSGVSGSSAS